MIVSAYGIMLAGAYGVPHKDLWSTAIVIATGA